jgi:uncharacterized membrane protein (DUF2068 family)
MESLQVNTSRDDRTESSAPPPQAQGSPQRTHAEHRRGLLLIGLFKLTKAVLAIGLGFGALKLLHHNDLRHFSMITFAYAVECLVEGTGLVLEKRWAEYFTVTLTSLALPLECYELYKEFTLLRVALLVVNLLVVVYLVWLLRRQLRRETATVAP